MITLTDNITVRLVQSMGGDAMVVAAAKVSTSGEDALKWAEKENVDANAGLINYLMSHRHGTPFEHAACTFFVHAPIFVWREWHRHRIGFCLAGDTDIWTESKGANTGRTIRKHRIKDLYDTWVNGSIDNRGRVRFLPSTRNQRLRVLNEDTGFFETSGISDIVQSGVKECLLVETRHKKDHSLRCSKDHPVLTSEGWVKAGDLCGEELIAVSGKRSAFETRQIPPSLRSGIGVWTSMQRNTLIPERGDNCYLCGKPFHRESLVLDHVVAVVDDLKLALDSENLKPACLSCHREKTNGEQSSARRCNIAGVRFVPIKKKPYVISEEMTYDISVNPPWHNFVANGIVVHNSYNEESARYKQLDPVFWIPSEDRKIVPAPEHTSARPKFQAGTPEQHDRIKNALHESYEVAYYTYDKLIKEGFAKEVSRACLPVAIYSSCWVTCNPRSLMAFLSLRTHDASATFVSYPQAEIETAARATEQIFAEGWPLTYASFCKNGRVGP